MSTLMVPDWVMAAVCPEAMLIEFTEVVRSITIATLKVLFRSTSSDAPGRPDGDQLLTLFQLVEAEPFQVFVAAQAELDPPSSTNAISATNRFRFTDRLSCKNGAS